MTAWYEMQKTQELLTLMQKKRISLKKVKQLLKEGANPDGIIGQQPIPLFRATELQNRKLIFLLRQHGANPNIKDFRGKTALFITTDINTLYALHTPLRFQNKQLLGTDLNQLDNSSNTVLHSAIQDLSSCIRTPDSSPSSEMIEFHLSKIHLLVNLGARTDIPNRNGKNAKDFLDLHFGLWKGDEYTHVYLQVCNALGAIKKPQKAKKHSYPTAQYLSSEKQRSRTSS